MRKVLIKSTILVGFFILVSAVFTSGSVYAGNGKDKPIAELYITSW